MAGKWVGYIFDETDLDGTELLCALALADHADHDGKCHVGIPRLAKKTRKSERQVKRILQKLEKKNIVEIERATGRGNRSEYQLKKVTSIASPFNDQNDGIKGDISAQKVTPKMSPFNEIKGDISSNKKVTPGTEKVTFRDVKGDIALSSPPTPPYKDEPFKPRNKISTCAAEERPRPPNTGAKTGSRIPPDFAVTEALIEWAETKVPEIDIDIETEKFQNYWKAKTGKDATKRDWPATWRNWMLNAKQWSRGNGNGKYQSNDKADRDRIRSDEQDAFIAALRKQGEAERTRARTRTDSRLLGDGGGTD